MFEGWVWVHGIKLKALSRPGVDVGTEPHLDSLQKLQCVPSAVSAAVLGGLGVNNRDIRRC